MSHLVSHRPDEEPLPGIVSEHGQVLRRVYGDGVAVLVHRTVDLAGGGVVGAPVGLAGRIGALAPARGEDRPTLDGLAGVEALRGIDRRVTEDRKSTRMNSSH